MKHPLSFAFAALLLAAALGATSKISPEEARLHDLKYSVDQKIAAEYASLEAIYKDIHAHPELSFVETRTAALVAKELRACGFEVTEKVGGVGVVGVMKNGPGPVILVRADMDALPIKELTGLPYASQVVMKDFAGIEQPAMHACAHDMHVTGLIGTARVLSAMKQNWSGTLIMIGQHAEEAVGGARAMLQDGLYTKFPTPNAAIALHVGGDIPAGQVGYVEGPVYANVDTVNIKVRGIGGHGARPHTTRDPVVLAGQIINSLQTIVARELKPGTPAVVTIGSIHGGTRANIIPAEVTMELTLRCYDEAVGDHLIASIKRICENLGRAAGLPDHLLPVVTVPYDRNPVTVNDVPLTRRLAGTFKAWFPPDQVAATEPATYGEDFAEFGRTTHKVPICIFWIGGTDPAVMAAAHAKGEPWPSNHSPLWAPVPEPTLKASVKAMSAAVLDLMARK
jgi:hippurate hydrolase